MTCIPFLGSCIHCGYVPKKEAVYEYTELGPWEFEITANLTEKRV